MPQHILAPSISDNIDIRICAEKSNATHFELVLLAAARARELASSHKTTLNYNPATHALLEAQEGKIGRHYLKKSISR